MQSLQASQTPPPAPEPSVALAQLVQRVAIAQQQQLAQQQHQALATQSNMMALVDLLRMQQVSVLGPVVNE